MLQLSREPESDDTYLVRKFLGEGQKIGPVSCPASRMDLSEGFPIGRHMFPQHACCPFLRAGTWLKRKLNRDVACHYLEHMDIEHVKIEQNNTIMNTGSDTRRRKHDNLSLNCEPERRQHGHSI